MYFVSETAQVELISGRVWRERDASACLRRQQASAVAPVEVDECKPLARGALAHAWQEGNCTARDKPSASVCATRPTRAWQGPARVTRNPISILSSSHRYCHVEVIFHIDTVISRVSSMSILSLSSC
jgi:hypothetical protein